MDRRRNGIDRIPAEHWNLYVGRRFRSGTLQRFVLQP